MKKNAKYTLIFCLMSSLALVFLCGCADDEIYNPSNGKPMRRPLPSGIDTLVIISEIAQQHSYWGANNNISVEAANNAFTQIAFSKGYHVVAPREDLARLIAERRMRQNQPPPAEGGAALNDTDAIDIGSDVAASGAVILNISIVQDQRYPMFSVNFGRSSRPTKQAYTQVTVTARILEVKTGEIAWVADATCGEFTPSSTDEVIKEALYKLGSQLPYHNRN